MCQVVLLSRSHLICTWEYYIIELIHIIAILTHGGSEGDSVKLRLPQ